MSTQYKTPTKTSTSESKTQSGVVQTISEATATQFKDRQNMTTPHKLTEAFDIYDTQEDIDRLKKIFDELDKLCKAPSTTQHWSYDPELNEVQNSTRLPSVLEAYNFYETDNEIERRLNVIKDLNVLFRSYVKCVGLTRKLPERDAIKLGGKLYITGTYQLGVPQKNDTIEAICVAPLIASRKHFFTMFIEILRLQSEVSDIEVVEDVLEPVIKLKYAAIDVHLYFVKLALTEVNEDLDLNYDNLLKAKLDKRSMRSLCRCRDTAGVLELVPNRESFQLALRFIVLWATKRGIYSDALGQFGSVTWAIMVARIAQLHPRAAASTIVQRFFLTYSSWEWSRPVMLTRNNNVFSSLFPFWYKRINSKESNLMPVITPTFPQQNATADISKSTKKIVMQEIQRGLAVTDEIMRGRITWDRLFEAPTFFHKYHHFLVLSIFTRTAAEHQEWCALVECEARVLVEKLESQEHIVTAHLNPNSFELKNQGHANLLPVYRSACSTTWFIGLEIDNHNRKIDATKMVYTFWKQVVQDGIALGIATKGMAHLTIRHIKRQQLNEYLNADLLQRDRKSMDSLSILLAQRKSIAQQPNGVSNKRYFDPESESELYEAKRSRIETAESYSDSSSANV